MELIYSLREGSMAMPQTEQGYMGAGRGNEAQLPPIVQVTMYEFGGKHSFKGGGFVTTHYRGPNFCRI